MKKSVFFAVMIMIIIGLTGLPQQVHAKRKKKERDFFFEKARFIMTKEEIDIYKHLESQKDKNRFIEEFWNKRDPNPTTEENENRQEFEKRIAYANKWFRETPKGEGWNTERGRILLQIGFPDRREWGELPITDRSGRLLTSKRIPMERWYYYRYQLMLQFQDASDRGRLSLARIPSNLLTTIDLAKFALDLREDYNVLKRSFKFNADYKNGVLGVTIPVNKLSFEENAGTMAVAFHTTVYIYRDSKKIDQVSVNKKYNWTKADLLKQKNITFDIPYALAEAGKYYFDVVVEELGSSVKFRDFVKYKSK